MAVDPCISLLRELVSIDSVNPSLVPGAAGESAVATAIAGELRAIGLEVHIQHAAPDRPNVIGVLNGRAAGRSLMLCGHIDTVGVAGMTRPFDPAERDPSTPTRYLPPVSARPFPDAAVPQRLRTDQ